MRRAAVIALAFTLICGAAAAGPRRDLVMARVEFGDLDLSRGPDAATMMRRLEGAARQLCAMERSPLLPRTSARAWRCRREAVAAAVARLSTPALQVAYADWLSADPTAAPPSPRHR